MIADNRNAPIEGEGRFLHCAVRKTEMRSHMMSPGKGSDGDSRFRAAALIRNGNIFTREGDRLVLGFESHFDAGNGLVVSVQDFN